VVRLLDPRPDGAAAPERAALTALWHRDRADEATAAHDWFGAAFHLNRLRLTEPDQDALRGRCRQVVAEAVRRAPKDGVVLAAHARVCLAAGDVQGYRAACAALRELEEKDQDPGHSRRAAWGCVLGPAAVGDYAPLLQAAEKDADAQDADALRTLGGLRLRAGKPEAAVEPLQRALRQRGPVPPPREELLLALACHQLEKGDEARRWLDRADEWCQRQRRAVTAAAPGPLGAVAAELADPREQPVGWQAWLELEILRREANQEVGRIP
jgi:hypothetical protein